MNRRTQLLIGLALVGLGIGVVAVGYASGESNVRYVEEVLARPAAHDRGSYVLMGVPQPAEVPVTGDAGVELVANPGWSDTIASTVRWSDGDGNVWFSTRTVTIASDDQGTLWSWRNETRRLPADTEPAFPVESKDWRTPANVRVVPVAAFNDGDGDTPRVWATYAGPLKDPMQPKPSQFTGHVVATLPDGSPVPDGVVVFQATEFKAGCSSKFLPPEEKVDP